MKKWKNFRDSYFRSVKKKTVSGQAAQNRAYVYARQLEFLTKTGIPSPTVSSLDEEPETEDVDDPGNDEEVQHVSSDVTPAPEAGPSTRPDAPPLPVLPATVPTAKRATSSFTKLPASKRRAIVEENLLNFMKIPQSTATIVQQTPPEQDDDRSFFESLLPLVKTLPIDAKLDFRVRVMGVLREMRDALRTAPSATAGSFPSLQRQMSSQPKMSNLLTPLVIPQQHQQPLHFTNAPPHLQTTQQPHFTDSFQSQWVSPGSSNASYTSFDDSNMD